MLQLIIGIFVGIVIGVIVMVFIVGRKVIKIIEGVNNR